MALQRFLRRTRLDGGVDERPRMGARALNSKNQRKRNAFDPHERVLDLVAFVHRQESSFTTKRTAVAPNDESLYHRDRYQIPLNYRTYADPNIRMRASLNGNEVSRFQSPWTMGHPISPRTLQVRTHPSELVAQKP